MGDSGATRVNGGVSGRVVMEWTWRVITVLLLPIMVGMGYQLQRIDVTLNALDKRLVAIEAIEASRFTTEDGFEMWREFDERLDALQRVVDGNENEPDR